MKPTVINNGNTSENSNPNVPQTTSNNVQSDTNNNTNRINNDPRGLPPSFSAREFGFDDSDDDIFSDMGLRSRMNRMGHPFDWGVRKRRGSTGHTEPQPNAYDAFFQDEPDFAGFGSPHWDTFNAARKRNQHPTADRTGFFDYLPPEFRQYVPENFGFPNMRQNPQMNPASAAFQKPPHPQQPQQQPHHPQQQQQYHPQQQQQYHPQQQQQYHPQQQQQYHPQQQQQYHPQQQQQPPTMPTSPKPNLCDAAIQTEDIDQPQTQANNLKQPGLRNTVDLGRKSQQEEIKTEGRAHSAPPREDLVAQQRTVYQTDHPNISQDTYGAANNSPYSNTGTSMTPQCNVPQPQFNAAQYQQQQRQPPTQQQVPQSPGQYTRSVPIFVEGRSAPLVNKINIPQENLDQSNSSQSNQQSQRQETPTQQAPKAQNRPGPFIAKENVPQPSAEQSQIPPQTPHTTDCINKIQDIQRDVLDLMGKVERFGGLKGDKEYMYLDEMLTRNLLKLDTIDTNGKESIRLARKEAIKCIQASIGVLDAKSEINAKPKETDKTEDSAEKSGNAEKSVENVTESANDPTKTGSDEAEALDTPKLVSQLQINLSDETSNEAKVPENENPASNANVKENDKPNEENVPKEQ